MHEDPRMMIGGVDLQKLSLGALVGLLNELSAREDFLRSVKAELEGRIRDAEVEDAPLAKKSKKDNSAEGLSSSRVAAMTQSDEEEKTDQGKVRSRGWQIEQ